MGTSIGTNVGDAIVYLLLLMLLLGFLAVSLRRCGDLVSPDASSEDP